ncbi:MAG TPA: metalloregulator ArsR/SmtB family transcription factor [Ktedonobacterales bacterium]|nr:metalloregulator ArsR/SmtB family transcription factor [Ktedonobacterales bacterium]
MRSDDTNTSSEATPENPEERMALLLSALKTLADLSRLRILGALATEERTVEALAELLDLKAPTVSHHLARLRSLGLVETRADGVTRWNRLRVEGLERLAKMLAAPEVIATLTADMEGATWERKTLRDFLDGDQLKEIPAQLKKRQVILRWLADQFDWDREYSEAEVNQTLKRRHPDSATLRRELIGERLLARDHGRYWRTEPLTEETLARLIRSLEWGRIYTAEELTAAIRQHTRDTDSARRELLARGALVMERDRYWLARPPEERLS